MAHVPRPPLPLLLPLKHQIRAFMLSIRYIPATSKTISQAPAHLLQPESEVREASQVRDCRA